MTDPDINSASFKDPAGFVFQYNGIIYRKVNTYYAPNYDLLMGSGLYDILTKKKWLLPHTECNDHVFTSPDLYKVLLPHDFFF